MFHPLTARVRLIAGAGLVAAAGLSGCDRGPQIVPASGIVLIDGQPLTYGYVQVIPKGFRPASGRIGGDGRFTLTTNVQGDGVATGTHQVAILSSESITPTNTKWHAPQAYADPKTSNLTVAVTGPTSDLKIELKSESGTPKDRRVFEGGTENSGFQFSN